MLYKQAVTIPSNTLETAPIRHKMSLTAGVIDKVSIEFPAGCAGLAGVRILENEFQLWPLTPGQWFVTDDFTIEFTEYHKIEAEPFALYIEGYNTDSTYDHTITVSISVSPPHEDPLKQVAEILERRERSAAPVTFSQIKDLRDGVQAIFSILYDIHAKDFPTLLQYMDQMRR